MYLYNDPPVWSAYIDAAKYFDFDALMDCYGKIRFDELGEINHDSREVIVYRSDEKIVTRRIRKTLGHEYWDDSVDVYYRANPPARDIAPEKIGLDRIPSHFEEVEGRIEYPQGAALLKMMKEKLGDQGVLGVVCGL